MRRTLITIAMLLVIVPLCAITAAGIAAHWSNYLKGENPVEAGGFMVMADVHWTMPQSWSHWVYEHYPTVLYEPAAYYLKDRFDNGHLSVWQPWSNEVDATAPHWYALIGAVLGLLISTIAIVLIAMYTPKIEFEKESESSNKTKPREQQPRKPLPDVETEGARQQRITDEKIRREQIQTVSARNRTGASEAPAKQKTVQSSQKRQPYIPESSFDKPKKKQPAATQQPSKPKPNTQPATASNPTPKQPAATQELNEKTAKKTAPPNKNPAPKSKPKQSQLAAKRNNGGDNEGDDDEDDIFDEIIN